ncbi:MAG: class GN sortase [Candidatus Eisenbacteria bacterium]|uniref:Class GN sortase n=1 Tax=Eiseniibacteriota bacterium TaxID=2212470 RepID=A0A956SCZ4_UNCEI|nr:class GN sortase [Candidatus Eisenbacteria bacterium]
MTELTLRTGERNGWAAQARSDESEGGLSRHGQWNLQEQRRRGTSSKASPVWLMIFAVTFFLAGGVLLGRKSYLWIKGEIAERRIEAVFARYLEDGVYRRPWPWADFRVLARLEFPGENETRSVIEGASGTSLAFAVGHVDGTSHPGCGGNVVLAGHRDGSFAILSRLASGDVVRVVTRGTARSYVVESCHVVEADDASWLSEAGDDRLTLVTCYPFGTWGESGLRYVVVARGFRAFSA